MVDIYQDAKRRGKKLAKVSEEETKEASFCPSDLVNTKTTIPLRVGEERWIFVLVFTKSDGQKDASLVSSSETFAKRRAIFLSF